MIILGAFALFGIDTLTATDSHLSLAARDGPPSRGAEALLDQAARALLHAGLDPSACLPFTAPRRTA